KERPLPPMKNTTLGTIVRRIIQCIPSARGATYVVGDDRVVITTHAARLQDLGLPPDTKSHLVEQTFRDVPLKTALHRLGFTLVIDARAEKKAEAAITAKLRHVPVETAVELLADMAGLTAVDVCGVFYVTSKDNAARMKEQRARLKAAVDDS